MLRVKGYGKRHLAGSLKDFSNERAAFGIGLSWLRERVREFRGRLDIQSNSTDTQISVTVPLGEETGQTSG